MTDPAALRALAPLAAAEGVAIIALVVAWLATDQFVWLIGVIGVAIVFSALIAWRLVALKRGGGDAG